MEPGSILQTAVERIRLVDHEGKSGAALERVLLADGRRLVVKRFSPSSDLVMALTGDTVGREYQLWHRGVLDRLPPQLAHTVVDGWVEPDVTVLVMRDLGDSVLRWGDRLSRARCRWVFEQVAAMHRAFLDNTPPDLTPLPELVGLFSPRRLAPHAHDANPLAAIALRGWEIFAKTVPGGVAGPVLALLDWSMPASAPGAVDVARFIAGCSSVVDATREEIIADFREASGPAYDEPALRLALLSGLVWLGWSKALDAVEHPDPTTRERESQDLDWWVGEARRTLESGLL